MENRFKTGDIYEVRLRNWSGRPIDKTTFSTTEKHKAAIAINRIMDNCDLDSVQLEELKIKEQDKEKNNQQLLKNSLTKPIEWRRDARGNII
jgi:hypothetical protein